MNKFIEWIEDEIEDVGIVGICFQLGMGIFILVSFVRCAFE